MITMLIFNPSLPRLRYCNTHTNVCSFLKVKDHNFSQNSPMCAQTGILKPRPTHEIG